MNLNWRLRQLGQNIVPIAIVGVLAYGGWNLYKKGTFRHGLRPGIQSVVGKIPVFGTHLRKYVGGKSIAKSSKRSGKKHSFQFFKYVIHCQNTIRQFLRNGGAFHIFLRAVS